MDDNLQQPTSGRNYSDQNDDTAQVPVSEGNNMVQGQPVYENKDPGAEEKEVLLKTTVAPENVSSMENSPTSDGAEKTTTPSENQDSLEEELESYMDDENQGY